LFGHARYLPFILFFSFLFFFFFSFFLPRRDSLPRSDANKIVVIDRLVDASSNNKRLDDIYSSADESAFLSRIGQAEYHKEHNHNPSNRGPQSYRRLSRLSRNAKAGRPDVPCLRSRSIAAGSRSAVREQNGTQSA